MSFSCGIVGMPNVGKSTLFNAITNTANAQAANYPFCTIEPNKASVAIPDERLAQLGKIANSARIVPTFMDVVDIAGLIKNASKGEGLGNKFLENIKSVDAIMHVVRCFEDKDVLHTSDTPNPVDDVEIIEMELLFSDIDFLEKRLINLQKKSSGITKEITAEKELCDKMLSFAKKGEYLNQLDLDENESIIASKLHLLTTKPMMYIANIGENDNNSKKMVESLKDYAIKHKSLVVPICAKTESEMIDFEEAEKYEMMKELGFTDIALKNVIRAGYVALDLITFFTVGEKETRAWSLRKGLPAPKAASIIHTDFEKGFIKADTIAFNDFIEYNGISGARNNGKLRSEGKEYIVQEGDIMNFKFNV